MIFFKKIYEEMYPNIPPSRRKSLLGLVTAMDDVIGNMEGPIIKDKAKDPLVLPCKIRLIRLQHLLGSKMDKTNQTAHMGLSFHTLPESNKGQEEKENLELPSNCVEVQTDNGRENVKDKV